MISLLTDELGTQSVMNRFYTYKLIKCIDRMGSAGNYLENDEKKSCDGLVVLLDGTVCPIFKNHSCSLVGLEAPANVTSLPEPIGDDKVRVKEFIPKDSLEESVREYNDGIVATAYTFPSYMTAYIVGFFSFITRW